MSRIGQVFPQPIATTGRVNSQTTNYTILLSDLGKLVSFNSSGSVTLTLPNPSSLGNSFFCFVENRGTGTLTISPAGGITLDGSSSSVALAQNLGLVLYTDGANWFSMRGAGGSTGGVNAQTGTSYTVASTDNNKLLTLSNSSSVAVTLPQASTMPSRFWLAVENLGAGKVTITPTTSTIDGAASIVLVQNEGLLIFSDGTNYYTVRGRVLGGTNVQTGTSYTIAATDHQKLVTFSNASAVAVTVPAPSSFMGSFRVYLENRGAGTVTLTPSSSTIDGASSLALAQNQGVILFNDGTNWYSVRGWTSDIPARISFNGVGYSFSWEITFNVKFISINGTSTSN